MKAPDAESPGVWDWDGARLPALARNLGTRYLGILVEAGAGLLVLPFNVHHLGPSAYGLWMLVASITVYFSVLDLGYAGSLVRFVAKYRARRDPQAINEILSTLFFVFTGVGVFTFAVALLVAGHLGSIFHLSAADATTAQAILLIVTAHVATTFSFSVFGGIINGFQRYYLNNIVGAVTAIAAAIVNVLVLLDGHGVVAVVVASTAVRIGSLFIYRMNAYWVFPALRLRPSLFRVARLREVTGFSIFMLLLDWANKINYSVDAIVIGGFLNTAAVAVWTVAQRLAEVTQRLTNQLNDILFPAVVDSDESSRQDRLRRIFVSGTRLSLGSVLPVAGSLMLLAHPLVLAWVGPRFVASVPIVQLLALVVIVRVGSATATTVLKGAGHHRLLTACNVSAAAANLLLSLLLVRPYGLAGVALGTLIPVTLVSTLVLFPAACRRSQLGVWRGLTTAALPAVWPLLAMSAWLLVSRSTLAVTVVGVMVDAAIGGLIYLALFAGFSIPSDERRLLLAEARSWVARRRVPLTA